MRASDNLGDDDGGCLDSTKNIRTGLWLDARRDLGFNQQQRTTQQAWLECDEHVLTVGKAQLAVRISLTKRNE